MSKLYRRAIIHLFKNNRQLTTTEVSDIVGCNEAFAFQVIQKIKAINGDYTDETQKMVRAYEDLHLESSLDVEQKGVYYLFTKIAEKKLMTEGFKILNSDDFSKIELSWLEENYKFRCKKHYLE